MGNPVIWDWLLGTEANSRYTSSSQFLAVCQMFGELGPFIVYKTYPKKSTPRAVNGLEQILTNSSLYLVRMEDFLERLIERLTCVPETEDDVYRSLRDWPDLRLMWFTSTARTKKALLKKLQAKKFELMMAGVEDDGA